MNEHTDIERVLERWFDDGPTRMPDRVSTVVADRIDRQRQRRPWRLPWRSPPCHSAQARGRRSRRCSPSLLGAIPAPAAAAAAGPADPDRHAVAIARRSTPSTAPSASPRFLPGSRPVNHRAGAGILPAGTSTTRSYKPGTSFTVPEGWVNDLDEIHWLRSVPGLEGQRGRVRQLRRNGQRHLHRFGRGPVFLCEAWEKTGGTAAERAAFLVASETFAVSEPVDVTIGDLTGKQVDMRVDPDWTATCPGDPPGSSSRTGGHRVTFLDTPGGVIAIAVGSKHAAPITRHSSPRRCRSSRASSST